METLVLASVCVAKLQKCLVIYYFFSQKGLAKAKKNYR